MGSVTISASYGAHGDRVGHAVARRLGLTFLDRAIPSAVAKQLRLSEESADAFDERAPSRWSRLSSLFAQLEPPDAPTASSTSLRIAADVLRRDGAILADVEPAAAPNVLSTRPSGDPDSFRLATEVLLREVADTSGAVILGRCGMVVLGGRADVLCVRLDGPLDARIARLVAAGTPESVARQTAKEVDGAREQYARFFYKVRQDDPALYHLVLDSSALPVDACVDLIIRAAQARFGASV